MMRRTAVLVVALLTSLPLTGSTVRGPQEARTAPSASAASSDVVVKVLGEAITEKQVLDAIGQIARSQQANPQALQTTDASFYRDALDTLIGGLLLKNEAKEKNINADPSRIEEALKSVKGQFPSETQYQQALTQQGLKEADLRKSIENNVLYQQVLEAALKDLPPAADADVRKFYDENPKYFEEPEQVHAAHVFLKADANTTPAQKAETRKRMEALRADVDGKKITFAEAAKSSDDKATAGSGGDLGFFKRGDMLPQLEDAVFAVKPGVLTPVIETEYGFHLMNVIEFKPAGKAPLEKVKPNIKDFLEGRTRQEATRKHIEELKGKVKIETLISDEEWNKRHPAK